MKQYCLLALLLFTTLSQAEETTNCQETQTTIEFNDCLIEELQKEKKILSKYVKASIERYKEVPELIAEINIAQRKWEEYVETHCDSIYTLWEEGSIRNAMALSCRIKLNKQRTHNLWSDFLTYMDSSPPVLPEPKFQ